MHTTLRSPGGNWTPFLSFQTGTFFLDGHPPFFFYFYLRARLVSPRILKWFPSFLILRCVVFSSIYTPHTLRPFSTSSFVSLNPLFFESSHVLFFFPPPKNVINRSLWIVYYRLDNFFFFPHFFCFLPCRCKSVFPLRRCSFEMNFLFPLILLSSLW